VSYNSIAILDIGNGTLSTDTRSSPLTARGRRGWVDDVNSLLLVIFITLLLAGCGEKTPEIEDKPSSLVADVDEVVDWVMDNYSSMESGFAKAENDLRSSDVPVIKILDDVAKLVSDRRIQSDDKKKQLIALRHKLEDKKLEIEKEMMQADSSMRESYGLALEKIRVKLDEKINPLLDFDFQYLEKFETDLHASILEWKRFFSINRSVLDESLIRNQLANRISEHFEENMARLIEERRAKWGKGGSKLPDTEESQSGQTVFDQSKSFSVSSIGTDMLWVSPGSFLMGLKTHRLGQRKVTLSKGFYLSKYEVTQGQWKRLMGSNPSKFKGADLPVDTISWNDAMKFCEKLTEVERLAGRLPAGMAYLLPTEAQWEYACRAGTNTAYSWGNELGSGDACWNPRYDNNQTMSVGSFLPNRWGFYDMHGNVQEWCSDWYADQSIGPVTDPTGPIYGEMRVYRGGHWATSGSLSWMLRSGARINGWPSASDESSGFRLSLRAVSK